MAKERRRQPPIDGCKGLGVVTTLSFVVVQGMGLLQGPSERMGLLLNWPAGDFLIDGLWSPLRLFTYQFLHGDPMHLATNLFGLVFFGPVLERRLGLWRFLTLYLVVGALAGVAEGLAAAGPLLLIGASGSVAGLAGCALVAAPRHEFRLPPNSATPFLILPVWVLAGFWLVSDLVSSIAGGDGRVAYVAHLSGLTMGMVAAPMLGLAGPPPGGGGRQGPGEADSGGQNQDVQT